MASQESPTQPGKRPPEKAALIAELAGARAGISENGNELAQQLDARQRLEQSVRDNPLLWAGGAAATGFALALLLKGGRSRATSEPRAARNTGISSAISSGIAAAIKPSLANYAQKTLTNALGSALHGEEPRSQHDPR